MSRNLDRSTWTRVRFGDVVANVNDNVNPAQAGIRRVLGLEHLDPNELAITRWGGNVEETTFSRRVRPGQTLFGKRRAYQRKTAYATFDAVCSGDILVWQSRDPAVLLPQLLPFLASTESFYENALRTSAGSLSPRTKWTDIAKYEFDLPPLDDQRRIADLLWALETRRATLRRLAATTRLAMDEALDEAFAALDDRMPLSAGVEESAYGPRFSSALYSESADYRLLRTTDMDSLGNIDYKSMPRAALDASYDRHLLRDGDFLISRSGTCGVPAVFDADKGGPKVIPGAFLIRLRLNVRLDPQYLRAFFNSRPGRKVAQALAQGGVQANIRGSSLLAVLVPIPSPFEQQRILERVSEWERVLRSTADEVTALDGMRAALASELLGEA